MALLQQLVPTNLGLQCQPLALPLLAQLLKDSTRASTDLALFFAKQQLIALQPEPGSSTLSRSERRVQQCKPTVKVDGLAALGQHHPGQTEGTPRWLGSAQAGCGQRPGLDSDPLSRSRSSWSLGNAKQLPQGQFVQSTLKANRNTAAFAIDGQQHPDLVVVAIHDADKITPLQRGHRWC